MNTRYAPNNVIVFVPLIVSKPKIARCSPNDDKIIRVQNPSPSTHPGPGSFRLRYRPFRLTIGRYPIDGTDRSGRIGRTRFARNSDQPAPVRTARDPRAFPNTVSTRDLSPERPQATSPVLTYVTNRQAHRHRRYEDTGRDHFFVISKPVAT